MKKIKQFSQIFLVVTFLTSCKTSLNKDLPTINTEENFIENNNSEKKRMEIKFSCEKDGISKYLADGWVILKEDSQEKICTWKSLPATKSWYASMVTLISPERCSSANCTERVFKSSI